MIIKKKDFWEPEIKKKKPYVTNILRIDKVMEWQNLIFKGKPVHAEHIMQFNYL